MGKYLSILGGSFVTQVLNSMIPGTKIADPLKMFLFKIRHLISLFRLYSTIVPFEIVCFDYLLVLRKYHISGSCCKTDYLYFYTALHYSLGDLSKRVEICKSTSKKILIYSFCCLKVGYHCFLQHIEICGCLLYIYRNCTS